ncbi:MAG: molybdopterin-dependent oxidoreductase, partial [Halobacteria archaeon]|nr:molybdopterin-dependent oxidoreductase [Halobacteria archaeon]
PVVDPDTPDWNPRGCNKGCVYSKVTYGDERIRQPMKQMGERGSGEWEPISWEEAYEEIADSIVDACLDNPQSIIVEPPIEGGVFQSMSPLLIFANALGGTVLDEVAEISDISAGQYMTFGKFHAASSQDEWFKADLNLVWHMNPVYTRIPAYHFLTENRYAGGELVTIAPDYSPSCVHADQYVPVEPASDAALALGMCRVIIEEGLVDESFVKEQTDLPLLVRGDNDRFLRESDFEDDGSDEQFYVWSDEGLTKSPQDTLKLDVEPPLEGTYEVEIEGETVEVRPVFERLHEKIENEYDLDTVQDITGIHPEVVEDLARKTASGKTNILVGFNTAKTFHGDLIERSMALLLALTGNWGREGTGLRSWCVVPEPGLIYGAGGGGGGGFGDLARMMMDDDNPTDEKVAIRGSMVESRFGFPTVPPVFYWYRHCGYDEVWDDALLENAGIPRDTSEYIEEALQRGWWDNLDRPAEGVDPRVMLVVGNNTLRRTRGATRNMLDQLWS